MQRIGQIEQSWLCAQLMACVQLFPEQFVGIPVAAAAAAAA
jgi:hypothetical protein